MSHGREICRSGSTSAPTYPFRLFDAPDTVLGSAIRDLPSDTLDAPINEGQSAACGSFRAIVRRTSRAAEGRESPDTLAPMEDRRRQRSHSTHRLLRGSACVIGRFLPWPWMRHPGMRIGDEKWARQLLSVGSRFGAWMQVDPGARMNRLSFRRSREEF